MTPFREKDQEFLLCLSLNKFFFVLKKKKKNQKKLT